MRRRSDDDDGPPFHVERHPVFRIETSRTGDRLSRRDFFYARRRHACSTTAAVGRATGKFRSTDSFPFLHSRVPEHGRSRLPRASPAVAWRWHALQQCLELCWSLCNLTASHRWLHAGNVHHLASTASSWAASTPAADREAVLHACVSRVLCGTAVTCVFVCKYFLKPVATHASPHSSWTWSTTARPEAAHIEPTGSAS